MLQPRRFKQTPSFKDRLFIWSQKIRADAEKVPPGPNRDGLLMKTELADTAAHIDDWINSPGLRPPK